MSDAPATFQTRLKGIMNNTYNPSMRRSVQTIVLYEADRCLKSVYKQLRPSQRKIALTIAPPTWSTPWIGFLADTGWR